MMNQTNFILNNEAFPCSVSENSEEVLNLCGPKLLDDIFKRSMPMIGTQFTGIAALMYALPYVAKFYKVNKDNLLQKWVDNFGIFRCFPEWRSNEQI